MRDWVWLGVAVVLWVGGLITTVILAAHAENECAARCPQETDRVEVGLDLTACRCYICKRVEPDRPTTAEDHCK